MPDDDLFGAFCMSRRTVAKRSCPLAAIACRGGGVSPARRADRMGGWPRALVGVLIGATLGAGSARAASLRASFDPSPDSSADTYLVFSCQGDSTVCTQGSYVSTPATWTLVDSQP